VRIVALVLFGVAITSAAEIGAAPVPPAAKGAEDDKAKLQGKWKVESARKGGEAVRGGFGSDVHVEYEFGGERFTRVAIVAGAVLKTTATATYGPEGRQVKTAGVKLVGPDGKPIDTGAPKDAAFGYAFAGDKLLLTTRAGDKPAADPLKPGPDDIVYVLVRTK
jgi:hypothetical protein